MISDQIVGNILKRHGLPPALERKKTTRQVGRHVIRAATLMLLMYRHGFRVAETVALRWDVVDLRVGLMHV